MRKFQTSVLSIRRRSRRSGFTLFEMLAVVALIAVLGTFMVMSVGGLLGGANEDAARQFVTNGLKAPLLQYRIHTGSFPSTEEGLNSLVSAPSGNKAAKWRGPYIDRVPMDPWQEPYQYRYPGTKNQGSYDLWSKGEDRQSGTADDIGNWE